MLTGDNSIFKNATKAKRDNAMSSVREQVLMAVNTAYTDYHAKEVTGELGQNDTLVSMTVAELKTITPNQSEVNYNFNESTGVVTLTYSKESYTVTGRLNLTTGAFSWD